LSDVLANLKFNHKKVFLSPHFKNFFCQGLSSKNRINTSAMVDILLYRTRRANPAGTVTERERKELDLPHIFNARELRAHTHTRSGRVCIRDKNAVKRRPS
jgi:hypothetical protein